LHLAFGRLFENFEKKENDMRKYIGDPAQEELLKEITSLLIRTHIPYMVTGALSVIFYGRPRASHDIDFVIEAKEDDIDKIIKAFSALTHGEFIIDHYLIQDAIVHRQMFNVLHLPTVLKLDFWILKDDEFDRQRFQRRKTLNVFGQKMTFASPEDTILIKLLWYKESKIEKHLIDAAFVYQIQGKKLDELYLKNWAKKQNTTKLLKELAAINLEQYY